MNPAAFALNHNRTALVLYGVLMLIGVQSFLNISRLEYPEFTIRNARVMTDYPGRSTLQVEQEVTRPLEQAIRELAEVHEVTSTSKPGLSIISVELDEKYFDLEDIWTDMRNKIDETQLPEGARAPRVLDDFGDVFPYVYALRGDGFTAAELRDYADEIRDELLTVSGVAKVEFHGSQDERIYLEYSSSEAAARQFTPSRMVSFLGSQNAVSNSGSADVGVERLNVVTLGEYESTDEILNTRMAIEGEPTTVRVSDFFTLNRDYLDPPRSFAHHNGERVLCISISMNEGGVVTAIGDAINEKLEEIQNELPWGLEIETVFFQPQYVEKSINDFLVNLIQAFVFVVIVMLLFAGWRLSLIVGFLVPSAILMCFVAMPMFGVALEMMSIAALIIALGLLVDNAVVVSEQVLVRLGQGQSRKDAVIGAVKSLLVPLLAASATTIAAFSPIAISDGGSSEFTFSLFVVVSLALLSSWVLSVTIVPLLCFWFLKPLKKDTLVGRGLNKLYKPYERVLRMTIKLRWGYPVLIVVLTMAAMWGFKFVPSIFFPPNERGQFVVDFELPPGTGLLETERQVTELENWMLREHPDKVRSVSSWVGNGGPRWYLALSPEPSNPNYAFMTVLTKSEDPEDVAELIDIVRAHGAENFAEARITPKSLENGPPVGDPIQIRLYGEDLNEIYALRDRIMAELKTVQGVYDLRDDWGTWVKQIAIDPDPVRAARLGLTTSTVAESVFM